MFEDPRDEDPRDDVPQDEAPAGAEPTAEEPAAADEPAAAEEPGAEEEPAADEALAADEPAPAGEPVAEAPDAEPAAEEPIAEEPVAAEDPAAANGPAPEEPIAEEPVAAEDPAAANEPAGGDAPDAPPAPEEPARDRRPSPDAAAEDEGGDEVIPGMHLEPDLVLEEGPRDEGEFGQYADPDLPEGDAPDEGPVDEGVEPAIVATPLDLAADARYRATGKRKSAVARVMLKPGEGTCSVNGRHLDEYFPRVKLQRLARQPLEATGNQSRMDVVARIHGGGVSAQATALRHGIARALVEADPALRAELKRRGYLTRDPRVKERKKAGLKKARKRPQFSKR